MLCFAVATIIGIFSCNAKFSRFIPPAGARFQIKNTITNKCLVSNNQFGDKVGVHDCLNAENKPYHDQWWVIKETLSESHQLQNTISKKCLAANKDGKSLNAYDCDFNLDQIWLFQNGFVNTHQLHNSRVSKCIANQPTGNLGAYVYDCYKDNNQPYPDQIWMFVLEPTKITNIEFDVDFGHHKPGAPISVAVGTCDNPKGGQLNQQIEVDTSRTSTMTSSFDNTEGLGLEIGTEFSIGIPGFTKDKITAKSSTEYKHKWGEANSFKDTMSDKQKIACAPGQKVTMKCSMDEAVLDIPYTMTLETIETKVSFERTGTWRSTQSFDLNCHYTTESSSH